MGGCRLKIGVYAHGGLVCTHRPLYSPLSVYLGAYNRELCELAGVLYIEVCAECIGPYGTGF